MSIKKEEIIRLGNLSNISLTPEQIDALAPDLENIIDYISQLDELDTDSVEPTYQCFSMTNVWRQDEITESPTTREELLSLSPETLDHQIKVPKVL